MAAITILHNIDVSVPNLYSNVRGKHPNRFDSQTHAPYFIMSVLTVFSKINRFIIIVLSQVN